MLHLSLGWEGGGGGGGGGLVPHDCTWNNLILFWIFLFGFYIVLEYFGLILYYFTYFGLV